MSAPKRPDIDGMKRFIEAARKSSLRGGIFHPDEVSKLQRTVDYIEHLESIMREVCLSLSGGDHEIAAHLLSAAEVPDLPAPGRQAGA